MIPENGLLHRWRVRIFGEADPVEEQLRDIARQGSRLAGWAHICAFALIVLFSLGSLVALSGEALARIAAHGLRPESIPAAISICVSTLLVVCMDMGMLYAAAMLRILLARRAERHEYTLHAAVIIGAAIIEAGTYVYMSWQYDPPSNGWGWALVAARALAAPLFSVYLSLARPLPIGPRDILYQVELSTGKGVIRDAVTIANDTSAPLSQKMRLYGASAVMTERDAARLTNMIAVAQEGQVQTVAVEDFPPRLPPPSSPPSTRFSAREEEYAAEASPEVVEQSVPSRIASEVKQAPKQPRGKTFSELSDEDLKNVAKAFLDADPTLSKSALQEKLGVGFRRADMAYRAWDRQPKPARLRAVGAE